MGSTLKIPVSESHSVWLLVCGTPFGSVYAGPGYFIGARNTPP